MSYDTIIIGAGLSGLAAGIRLAYFDRKVCVLERHTTIGGLNSFYRLRNRNYDVGLHAVTNYAAPGTKTGPLSKLLRQLRLQWDDFQLFPQLQSAIVFGDRMLRFTNNFDFLTQEVAEQFPKQIDNFRRLAEMIDKRDDWSLDPKPLSAREVVSTHISDPLLVDMIFCPLMFYGSPTPHDMDFSQFVIMFKSIFCEGFGRPLGGVRSILKTLVRKFMSAGGELHLRAGVRSIQIEQNRAVGVVLDDGREIESRNILSSAGSVETAQLCGDSTNVLPQIEPGEISFLESIFTLDRLPAELGHNRAIVFYNDSSRFRYECPVEPADIRSGIVCSPNNFDYDSPLSEGTIRITALANPNHWFRLPEEDYVAQKKSWCGRMAESAVRFVPDFRPHALDEDTFTPRTIKKFTGHLNGCVYGAPRKVVDGKTQLENLFLCGTDQGFLGIVGSMLSGILITNQHLLR